MNRKIVKVVRTASLLGLLAVIGLSSAGCFGTPAYTREERSRLISRSMRYEFGQAVDDWDSFWMLRPPSRSTIWNVR